jgi:hypothetical protein
VDIASLTLLSNIPHFYLLSAFYSISLQTCLLELTVQLVAISLPMLLLRPRNALHVPARAAKLPNHSILQDPVIRVLAPVLASTIYAVVLYAAQHTFLPVFMVRHFDGLATVEAAHSSILPSLFAGLLPVGFAAREFLLFPVMTSAPPHEEEPEDAADAFDPATATLGETFWYNFWGWSAQTKTLMKRTAALLVFQGLNVAVKTGVALNGVDVTGAVGWAGLWATSGLIVSAVFRWVGDI